MTPHLAAARVWLTMMFGPSSAPQTRVEALAALLARTAAEARAAAIQECAAACEECPGYSEDYSAATRGDCADACRALLTGGEK